MTYKLGLTGGIGMGKSTTAKMFRDLGYPVWDADEAVHKLYSRGGKAVAPLTDAFPEAVKDGAVDRKALTDTLKKSPQAFARLEAIVHPLVAADRKKFIDQHIDSPLIVMDIPLLFENGSESEVDGIAVVTTDPETQHARVMARPGMTEEKFRLIVARQTPDDEKKAKADWIIATTDMVTARDTVEQICTEITRNA